MRRGMRIEIVDLKVCIPMIYTYLSLHARLFCAKEGSGRS